jgi:hypothetical protein
MAYVVRMRKYDAKGPIFGTMGPFETQELAHETAQVMADQAAPSIVVTIEPFKAPAKKKAAKKKITAIKLAANPRKKAVKKNSAKKAVPGLARVEALFAEAKPILGGYESSRYAHYHSKAGRNAKAYLEDDEGRDGMLSGIADAVWGLAQLVVKTREPGAAAFEKKAEKLVEYLSERAYAAKKAELKKAGITLNPKKPAAKRKAPAKKRNPGMGAALKLAKKAGSAVAKKAAPHAKSAAKKAAVEALDMARAALKANPKRRKNVSKASANLLVGKIASKLTPRQMSAAYENPFFMQDVATEAAARLSKGETEAKVVAAAVKFVKAHVR